MNVVEKYAQETIHAITEIDENDESGFAIKTNKQTITMTIENHQNCCEDWGYFMSEDDFSNFIGSRIISIKITDTSRNTSKLEERDLFYKGKVDVSHGDIMFVDIITDKGVLQFVAYNSHNGYYGHSAYIRSTQLNCEEHL